MICGVRTYTVLRASQPGLVIFANVFEFTQGQLPSIVIGYQQILVIPYSKFECVWLCFLVPPQNINTPTLEQ